MKHSRRLKRTAFGTMLLTSTVLLFMFVMVGTSLAKKTNPYVHEDEILLRDCNGTAIPYPSSSCDTAWAFSVKETCGYCHNGEAPVTCNGTTLLSYDQIEQGSYHAQMGANNLYGWKTASPTDKDGFRRGKAPSGKAWVQSKGHFGKW